MSKPLSSAAELMRLRAFVRASSDDDMTEVRAHCEFYAAPIADAFGETADALIAGMLKCTDTQLRHALLNQIERTLTAIKAADHDVKAAAQQTTLDGFAASGPVFDAERFARLLSTAMPPIDGYLEFRIDTRDCDNVCAISARKLMAVRALKRRDLTAVIDRNGLHIRGGLTKLRLTLYDQRGTTEYRKKSFRKSLFITFTSPQQEIAAE